MIAAGHTSVGVVIGVAASELLPASLNLPTQVLLVGLVGIASHYAMDLVPHGHYEIDQAKPTTKTTTKLVFDLVIPILLLGVYLLLEHGLGRVSWLVGAGVLGAQLPDVINGLRSQGLLPPSTLLDKEGRFHSSTHWHNPSDASKATREGGRRLGWSDVWQVAMAGLAIMLLLSIG